MRSHSSAKVPDSPAAPVEQPRLPAQPGIGWMWDEPVLSGDRQPLVPQVANLTPTFSHHTENSTAEKELLLIVVAWN